MNGLQEIIAINNHSRAVLGDQERRALGLKPATATGKILREVAAKRPLRFRAPVKHPLSGGVFATA